MKSSVLFQLENAGWPALLLDSSTTICRANPAAVRLFGPTLEGATPLLAAIWSSENGTTPEPFLAQWERSPASAVLLKFRTRGGSTISSFVSICSVQKEGQKYFLLQLPPENPGTSSAEANPTMAESGLIHKQKLECALQLARTVALD